MNNSQKHEDQLKKPEVRTSWTFSLTRQQRRVIRDVLQRTKALFEDSKRSNQPIIGQRPRGVTRLA